MPLLATLGAPLSISNGGGGCCSVAAAWGCFPTARDREKFCCLLAGGILGSDAMQLLDGVPENVVLCPEG
jgi:hypothetical protein